MRANFTVHSVGSEVSLGDKLIVFAFEIRLVAIVTTKLTVKNIPYLGRTLPTLLSPSPHLNKHTHIEVCLQTQQRFYVFAVPAGC